MGTRTFQDTGFQSLLTEERLWNRLQKKCKELGICFTAEEFLDLWTTPYSDCVNIDGWHAPTAYDIVKFIKSVQQTPVWKR